MSTHVTIDIGPCMNSTILCEQITSVAVDKVGDYMCRIPEYLETSLDLALKASLGLPHKVYPDPVPVSPYEDEIKALKHHISKLEEELAITKEANEVIKEKASFSIKAIDSANARADMYERMYNDLIERLVSRGAK